MQILPNIKISHKLGLVLIVTLLSLGGIGAVYMLLLQTQEEAATQVEATEDFVLKFEEAGQNINRASLAAERFYATDDPARFELFQEAMSAFNGNMAELENLQSTPEQGELVRQVRDAATFFQHAVRAAFELKTEVGLDQNSGVHGQMRVAVHNLEDLLRRDVASEGASVRTTSNDQGLGNIDPEAAANMELEILMLTMRRHEKDYIQREDDKYVEAMYKTRETFLESVRNPLHGAEETAQYSQLINQYFSTFLVFVEGTKRVSSLITAASDQAQTITDLLASSLQSAQQSLQGTRADAGVQVQQLNTVFTIALAVSGLLIVALIALVAFGITRALGRLQYTVQQVAEGDLSARALMSTGDELGQLGNAFDNMLDQRVNDLQRAEKENAQLNDSVINLMDAADRLSKRDLTVVVPVSEDITGNVSDALNQMARQTAKTMSDINRVAAQLEKVANAVNEQGEKVSDVASVERQVVADALQSLEKSAATMAEMVKIASSADSLADNASDSTKKALGAVRTTVQSMGEIRNSVSEAEKSIKRLGERSQEIGAIVEIIKDIAERTHTLALNAGMQAVAAGEAGRGFSVVADEVQRLAETARESTNQIAALVNSIQAESSESMTTMNKTITQVVQGSELAERAGKRMRVTQKATQELVESVTQIAERSKLLETTNQALREQAGALQQSTEATERELQAQAEQTKTMFTFLQNLVQSIRVFKLPEAA